MNGHEKILGVEGGGTKTAWVLVERDGADMRVVKQGKLPPVEFSPCDSRAVARDFFRAAERN